MENKSAGGPDPQASAAAARQALDAVEELETASTWWPARWAGVLFGVIFAGCIAAFSWESFWWGFGLLGLFALPAVVLRRQIFNPYIRVRPWQRLENQEPMSTREQWLTAGFSLWVPMTILVPTEPRWIGGVVGAAAGIHLYHALKKLGVPK